MLILAQQSAKPGSIPLSCKWQSQLVPSLLGQPSSNVFGIAATYVCHWVILGLIAGLSHIHIHLEVSQQSIVQSPAGHLWRLYVPIDPA